MNNITEQSLQEIIHDLNRDIKPHPAFADAYCTRGMLKYCLRDIHGAFNDWSVAIDLGCKNTIFLIKYLTILEATDE